MNVQDLISEANLEYRLCPLTVKEKTEISVRVCPFCGDDNWHFFASLTSGLFSCKKCFIKGTGNQLEHKLRVGTANNKAFDRAKISEYHNNLLTAENVMRYLTEIRGFSKLAIHHFKLGYVYENGKDWIVMPYFEKGFVVDIKYRTELTKEFRKEVGGKPTLYNIDNLDTKRSLIIVEGEMDCISAWSRGLKNVVSVPSGATSFPIEYIDFVRKFPTVYLCFDSDEAGQYGAKCAAEKIGYDKCKNLILPLKDLNEFFVGGNSTEEFLNYVKKAPLFEIYNIVDIKGFLRREKLLDDNTAQDFMTPWSSVNSILRRFKGGEVMVLSGMSGVGKTTIALNMAVNLAKTKVPCLFWCLEMPIRDLLQKITCAENTLKLDEIKEIPEAIKEIPLYFSAEYVDLGIKNVEKLIVDAISRYGIKVLFFDNLQFLERGDDITQKVSQATKMFKMLALKHKIAIVLISHVKKRIKEEFELDDLKGSSSIHQDSDIVIFLYRRKMKNLTKEEVSQGTFVKTDILEPLCWVGFAKARMGSGGETFLWLEKDYHRFKEIDEEIQQKLGSEYSG